MLSVSSSFIAEAARKHANWKRVFTIGASDYASNVTKWPSIERKWDDATARTVTIDLSNESQTFNFLANDPSLLHTSCSLQLGFTDMPSNHIRYSSVFSGTSHWVRTNVSMTYSYGRAPDSSFTATNLIDAGSYSTHLLRTAVNLGLSSGPGEYWTFSAYVKPSSNNRGILFATAAQSAWASASSARFYPSSGTVASTSSGAVSSIESAAGGWYRCRITTQPTETAGGFYPYFQLLDENNLGIYSGDGTSGVQIWGAQLERYNVHRTYIPTSAEAVDGTEMLTLFAGTIDAARYREASCSLTLIDKFRRLADKLIGTTTTPTNYTSSDYLVHDLTWYAMTSHAGLSSVKSSSNPDIDYTSFSSWTSVWSTDNVRLRASFTGQKVVEALKTISDLTQSAIFIEQDRLKFHRFSLADSTQLQLDPAIILDSELAFDDRELVNKYYVGAGYDATSGSFAMTCFAIDSDSVSRYGTREASLMEKTVWLTDSVSALNAAQRVVLSQSEIQGKHTVNSTLSGLHVTIGDCVLYVDSHMQFNDNFRVMGETIDMDSGKKTFSIDQSQYFNGFRLDYSALDSSDVLL